MSTPMPSNEEELFSRASEMPVVERPAYLAEACAGDDALRARVEALLRADAAARSFMASPPAADLADAVTQQARTPTGVAVGDRIGRYKLLQQLGEGGCGVVFMAEQDEPVRRRVALKVIKLGMDTKEVIARFEAERQALALMDHPNIARVFDGGATEAGRPYFVMELVRGVPITKFCDEQNLPTRARLELFTAVCHAVQHAHQKGIIHRDLKPSNILVTLHDGLPVPKVIDFGIAKATQGRLTDATLFTAFEQFIGTPAYMSPEQAEMSGLDIDTRADIYSLGILLYELLTGRPPFDPKTLLAAGLDEVRRIIREVDPPRMSTRLSTLTDLDRATVAKQRGIAPAQLSTLLRGDLDWIVMRCLEKDRTRRYETANGLALDVLRHLHDEPVVARPPSAGYRLQKLVRRNRLAFSAAAAIAATLVLGAVIATWQAVRATHAERIAHAERQTAVTERSRAERARHEAEAARTREAELRGQAEANEKKAEAEAARSAQVAQFMRDMLKSVGPYVARGRDTKLLRDILDDTARRIDRDLAGQPQIAADLGETLASAYFDIGDVRRAVEAFRRVLAERRKLAGNFPDRGVTSALEGLGNSLLALGSHAEAEACLREALILARQLPGVDSSKIAHLLARVLELQRKSTEAEAVLRELLAVQQKHWRNDHPQIARTLSLLGQVVSRRHQPGEGEELARASIDMLNQLGQAESFTMALSLNTLAMILRGQRRWPEAEATARELVALRRRLGSDHADFATALALLGSILGAQGKHGDSVAARREAAEASRKAWGSDHRHYAFALNALGSSLLGNKQYDVAQVALNEALAILRNRGLESDTSTTLSMLGMALAAEGKLAEAEARYRERLAVVVKQYGEASPNIANPLIQLSGILKRQGKLAEAASIDQRLQAIQERRPVNLNPQQP